MRQGCVSPHLFKELHAQLTLELLDLHRDGGLGIIQSFRRTGEALELRDF